MSEKVEGTRYENGKRFDLLEPTFIDAMAHIMFVGNKKYPPGEDGSPNWKKGLGGDKGGINHALAHITEYQQGLPNDYGPLEMHLAQVAINAMFEFHFERQRRLAREQNEVNQCLTVANGAMSKIDYIRRKGK